jgi:hypothetical protein
MSYHSSGGAPIASRHPSLRRLAMVGVVVSSAKQKQQLHPQQLTNGSNILKTFTFPEFLDLFLLIYSIFWIYFSEYIS